MTGAKFGNDWVLGWEDVQYAAQYILCYSKTVAQI